MNNPGHNGSHFNKGAERLARMKQQKDGRDVPPHIAAQTELELMELLQQESHD